MKWFSFFKAYGSTLALLWGATVLFGVSLGLAVFEMRHHRAVEDRWRAVQEEEKRLQRLEAFAASLVRYDAVMQRLTGPREAAVQEKIALEPFGAFVEKLTRIYTDQGFFFLDSFSMETCQGGKTPGEAETDCRPYAELKGRKVYFQP